MSIPCKMRPAGLESLPMGYTRLEYLESTGTQWIDTGIIGVDFCDFEIEAQATKEVNAIYFFNVRTSDYSNQLLLSARPFRSGGVGDFVFQEGAKGVTWVKTGEYFEKIHVVKRGRTVSLNGDEKTIGQSASYNTVNTIPLWASKVNSAEVSDKSSVKIWTFSLESKNGKLDFVPALDPTGTPCMFDLVTRKPFYNKGTGQFIAGLTMKQALNLANLPATGGSLTISLPKEATLVQHNQEVEAALETAAEKGWNIPVQYRDEFEDSSIENKYAACKTVADITAVNPDHQNDLTEDGEWIYPLDSLKSATRDWVTGVFSNVGLKSMNFEFPSLETADMLLYKNASVETVALYLPKASTLNRVLSETKKMTYAEIKLNGQNVTNCFDTISRGSKTKKIKVWNVGEWIGSSCFHYCPQLEEIEFEAQKLTELFTWFVDDYKLKRVIINDVSKVTTAYQGYDNCYALEEFPTVYPALSNGELMFRGCRLKKQHVIEILNGIPAWSSGKHVITVGIHVDYQGDEEISAAVADAEAKGWTVTVQWNGTPTAQTAQTAQTASTFGLRKPPIYAKLGEIEHPDGTIRPVLDWGHYITNWEENGYQEFASIEEAYEHFNLEMPAAEESDTPAA